MRSAVSDKRSYQLGDLLPAKGFLFVWVEILITKTDSLPTVLNVLDIKLADQDKRANYTVGGVRTTLPEIENMEPSVTSVIETAGIDTGIEELDTTARDAHDAIEFKYSKLAAGKRTGTLTVKAVPASFALLFAVPGKEGNYTLDGLLGRALVLGKLTE